MITLAGVRKSFVTAAGELQVLKGIDASIERGEMAAIVGASGVGKSTLLHIMGTLDRPTSGTVTYEGTDVFSMGEKAITAFRNRTVGFVFQFHHLLPEFTALENVLMPALINGSIDRREAVRTALGLLEELGISDRRDHRPGELSGGEQQRVAVARALVLSPSVVLADEPTGNLDTATGEELFRLLIGLNETRGITFVVVTHNESLSSRCHRIFEMKDGRLRAKEAA